MLTTAFSTAKLRLESPFITSPRLRFAKPESRTALLNCRASAAADALQFNNAIRLSRFSKRRRGDVINGDSSRSFAVENAVVSMTVKNSGHFESIDWLFQPAGAEKRINLGILPLQRGADRRVMQHYDPLFGLQFGQRLLKANSVTNGFLNKLFDERFAPGI